MCLPYCFAIRPVFFFYPLKLVEVLLPKTIWIYWGLLQGHGIFPIFRWTWSPENLSWRFFAISVSLAYSISGIIIQLHPTRPADHGWDLPLFNAQASMKTAFFRDWPSDDETSCPEALLIKIDVTRLEDELFIVIRSSSTLGLLIVSVPPLLWMDFGELFNWKQPLCRFKLSFKSP